MRAKANPKTYSITVETDAEMMALVNALADRGFKAPTEAERDIARSMAYKLYGLSRNPRP